MSGHYTNREIKIIETTYHWDNKSRVSYEIRAYNSDNDDDYEVLAYCDELGDIFNWFR